MQLLPQIADRPSTWRSLAPLRRLLAGKPALYLAYSALWDLAGGGAGSIVVSHRDLGADNGVSPRTAQLHVEALVDLGLVELVDHDRRSGSLRLYVIDFRELGQPRRVDGDPQREMEFVAQDVPDIGVEDPAEPVRSLGIERPPVGDPKPSSLGGFCAETPEQLVGGEPLSLPKLPQRGPFDRKPPSERKPPSAAAAPGQFAQRASPLEVTDRSGVCAPKPPSAPMVTIERNNTLSGKPSTHRQPDSMETMGREPAAAVGGFGAQRPEPTADALNDFYQRRTAAQVRHDARLPRAVAPIVAQSLAALADRIEAAGDPVEAKLRLARMVRERVNDPGTHQVVFARAAEYVLEDGLPLSVLTDVLDELDKAAQKGQLRASRGSWFAGVLNRRLRAHGIRQHRRRQPRKESV